MQNLTEKQKHHLRGLGHKLKPVVMMGGKGLTDAVIKEVEGALIFHELIKIKLVAEDRDARKAVVEEIAKRTNAIVVQRVGNILLLFRRNPEAPKISFHHS